MNKAVTFSPSEDLKMVMVPIRQDNVFEGEEVFTAILSLAPGSNGVEIGRQSTATTAIVDGRELDVLNREVMFLCFVHNVTLISAEIII